MTNNIFENVNSQANIVEVVAKYLKLVKKGHNYWALCPFHEDSKPSLSISESKQIYKCFSCNAGGNATIFVQNHEQISALEAAKKVIDICSLDIQINQLAKKDFTKLTPRQEKIIEINNKALDYFNLFLKSSAGKQALNYLKKRGITTEIIDVFDLGLSPKQNQLIKLLQSLDYEEVDILNSGLTTTYNNQLSDFFKNRIIFPIKNSSDQPVAFSGRIYQKGQKGAKYKNTSETPVFNKSHILYNFTTTQKASVNNKELIIVEGFMDVIALYKCGIKNVIATMGTAFSSFHLKLIKSCVKKVKLFLDPDEAGKNATFKIAQILLKNGLEVKIVETTDRLDVDEIQTKLGSKKVQEIVEKAKDFYQFVVDNKLKTIDENNLEQVDKFINFITPILLGNKNQVKNQWFMEKVKSTIKVDLKTIVNKERKRQQYQNIFKKPSKKYLFQKYDEMKKCEYEIIQRLIKSPDACKIYVKKLGFLIDENRKVLANFIIDYYNSHDEFDEKIFLKLIENKAALLNEFNEAKSFDLGLSYSRKEMIDLVKKIKKLFIKKEIERLKKMIAKQENDYDKSKILQQIIKMKNSWNN